MYTRNRNFRLYLSCKLGKNTPLLVSKENLFRSSYVASYSTRSRKFNTLMDSLVCNVRWGPVHSYIHSHSLTCTYLNVTIKNGCYIYWMLLNWYWSLIFIWMIDVICIVHCTCIYTCSYCHLLPYGICDYCINLYEVFTNAVRVSCWFSVLIVALKCWSLVFSHWHVKTPPWREYVMRATQKGSTYLPSLSLTSLSLQLWRRDKHRGAFAGGHIFHKVYIVLIHIHNAALE